MRLPGLGFGSRLLLQGPGSTASSKGQANVPIHGKVPQFPRTEVHARRPEPSGHRDGAPGKGLGRVNPESSLILQSGGWRTAPEFPGRLPPTPALSSCHPQSRPCRHTLAQAVQRHPHFRSLFNFSKPVLLSGGLFTQGLWDHLSRRKAPYGWQGLSHQGNQSLPIPQPSGLSWSLPPAFGPAASQTLPSGCKSLCSQEGLRAQPPSCGTPALLSCPQPPSARGAWLPSPPAVLTSWASKAKVPVSKGG